MHDIVQIEGDCLVIRLDPQVLKAATECCPTLCTWDDEAGEFRKPEVIDIVAWMKAVATELRRESEDGTTPVHKMLDQAFLLAVEGGAEGLEIEP